MVGSGFSDGIIYFLAPSAFSIVAATVYFLITLLFAINCFYLDL